MPMFECLFIIRKNVIIECAKFNKQLQLPDEPAKQLIVSHYNQDTDFNFGDLRNKLIYDKIIVRIQDTSLLEHLQMDLELTLEKAKTLV